MYKNRNLDTARITLGVQRSVTIAAHKSRINARRKRLSCVKVYIVFIRKVVEHRCVRDRGQLALFAQNAVRKARHILTGYLCIGVKTVSADTARYTEGFRHPDFVIIILARIYIVKVIGEFSRLVQNSEQQDSIVSTGNFCIGVKFGFTSALDNAFCRKLVYRIHRPPIIIHIGEFILIFTAVFGRLVRTQ